MQDSVFTKIIKGELPSHKIYEDDLTLAFLNIHPLRPGHVLVVPKTQVDHFDALPDAEYGALFAAVKKVAKHLKAVTGKKRAVVLIMGFDVPHTHVHIVPADRGTDIYEAFARISEIESKEPDHDELAKMAEKLRMKEGE